MVGELDAEKGNATSQPSGEDFGDFAHVFRNRSVMVTGHTGFKGSWLCLWLVALGARVTGFSTDRPLSPRNSQLCNLKDRIARHVQGDVRDADALKRCVQECQPDLILHLAAQPLVLDSYRIPGETMDVNVSGTVNLLEAVRCTSSVRAVVVITTDKVYEETTERAPYREPDRLAGRDPYSASKAMAELAVRSYRLSWDEEGFAQGPCALATARSGNVVGGGDFASHRLIPDCFRSLMAGQPFALKTPTSIRPWQSVFDPTAGYLWLGARMLEEGPSFAGAWNFGPPASESVTCETLARRLSELWGAEYAPDVKPVPLYQAEMLLINSDKAASQLQWTPLLSWEDTLAKAVDWFKEYDAQRAAAGSPDMHAICMRQIQDYVRLARGRKAAWAR
jgi:CDP-glucose 4,6-dehydratase